MKAEVFDKTVCELGEGPLWHPLRNQLFWFDIEGHSLHAKDYHHNFGEYVSAAGWIAADLLFIASESALFTFDLTTGHREDIAALEADNPVTRSNDGRADPKGGFWIGTMGKKAEDKAGAIYRFYRGQLRKVIPDITVSNSICFSPAGDVAYFSDTATRIIQKIALDSEGWPAGDPEIFVDLNSDELNPDGSVVDASGNVWNAQWGAARVACYSPEGDLLQTVAIPGRHTTCPAFGGPQLTDLYVTTALNGQESDGKQGLTYLIQGVGPGQAEHQVVLP